MTFKPMLAYNKTPDLSELTYPLIASPKLDGIRCVVLDGVAYSRSMKSIPNLHVQKMLSELDLHGLDGELMLRTGDFNNVQSAIMSVHGKPDFTFNVFDDVTNLKLGFDVRIKVATSRVTKLDNPVVEIVQHHYIDQPAMLQSYWDGCIVAGHEGAMARKITGQYKCGRSTLKQGLLIKLKEWHDAEATVVGVDELHHNENEAELGELGQTKRSKAQHGLVPANTLGALRVVYADKTFGVGTGFTDALRKELWQKKESLIGQTITFKYLNLSSYGVPRHPVFKGFRYE